MEWWQEYWGNVYFESDRKYDRFHEKQANALAELFLPGRSRNILDLGCGYGAHSFHLTKNGFRVTGLDYSARFTGIIKRLFFEKKISFPFIRADMRNLPFEESFHFIFNLYSAIGCFGSRQEDLVVIREIKNALLEEGEVLIDLENLSYVSRENRGKNKVNGKIGTYEIESTFFFDEKESTLNIDDRIKNSESPGVREKSFSQRIYSAEEMIRLFEEVGLEVIDIYGDVFKDKFTKNSKRMVIYGRRKNNS